MRVLTMKALLAAGAVAIAASSASAATLVADGVTYSLTYSVVNASTWSFTLDISGINGASDTEGGRVGVNAIAFNNAYANTQPTAVTAPSGFTYVAGGLNASGCNGSGNFFCFKANTTPSGSALAADSMLSYSFQISTAPTAFPSVFSPDFKIDWVGSKRNYDLVSQTLTADPVSTVPLPAAGVLLAGALGGLGVMRRKKKAA